MWNYCLLQTNKPAAGIESNSSWHTEQLWQKESSNLDLTCQPPQQEARKEKLFLKKINAWIKKEENLP